MVTADPTAPPAAEGGDAERILAALPQLAQEDLIPEVNSLAIGHDGRVILRARRPQLIVTYDHAGHRVTARFARSGSDGPVTLELGCRLVRLPFTIEARDVRRELLRRIALLAEKGPGELALTPQHWLYLRERVTLDAAPFTASWLLTQLTLATLILSPAIELFADLTPDPDAAEPEERPSEH